jgi:hypothetical protein
VENWAREVNEQLASVLQTIFDEKLYAKTKGDEKLKTTEELDRTIQAKLSEKKPTIKSNGSKGTDVELTGATQNKIIRERAIKN